MKPLLMASLLCLAFNASAACTVKQPGPAPILPDAAVTSEEEMNKAHVAAEKYLLQAQAYMDCGVMNRRQHLALTAQLEEFARAYRKNIESEIHAAIIPGNENTVAANTVMEE
jgi:hypothetical protein